MEQMLCPECGAIISGKYKAFAFLRDKLSNNAAPDTHFIDTTAKLYLEDIYSALNIDKFCTRMHFQTAQKRE